MTEMQQFISKVITSNFTPTKLFVITKYGVSWELEGQFTGIVYTKAIQVFA